MNAKVRIEDKKRRNKEEERNIQEHSLDGWGTYEHLQNRPQQTNKLKQKGLSPSSFPPLLFLLLCQNATKSKPAEGK